MKEPGKDILQNNYFYLKKESQKETFQTPSKEIYNFENIFIPILAMDFPSETSYSERKLNEENWKNLLPTLTNVKHLSIRHRVDQDFFESICEMSNLESLFFWTSTVEDLTSISKLTKLKSLRLDSFSRLEHIHILTQLNRLEFLTIDNSFKISDYETIGLLTNLKALRLGGDTFAPRNLILESLKPYTNLKKLKHLDLSDASIRDKSYEVVLELTELKRLDAAWKMKEKRRADIINKHPNLDSGFFVVYDFKKNQFQDGVEWFK